MQNVCRYTRVREREKEIKIHFRNARAHTNTRKPTYYEFLKVWMFYKRVGWETRDVYTWCIFKATFHRSTLLSPTCQTPP